MGGEATKPIDMSGDRAHQAAFVVTAVPLVYTNGLGRKAFDCSCANLQRGKVVSLADVEWPIMIAPGPVALHATHGG